MRKGIKKQFWLSEKDAADLRGKAQKCGLTETAVIRQLLHGYEPREKPGERFYAAMQETVMSGTIRYPSAKHENIRVTVNGDTAITVGQTMVEAVTAGGSNTWPLQMDIDLTKIDGQWKMREVRTSIYK